MSTPQPSDSLTQLIRHHSTITGEGRNTPTCTGCNTTLASYEDHTRHIADMIIQAGWTAPPTPAINPTTDN